MLKFTHYLFIGFVFVIKRCIMKMVANSTAPDHSALLGAVHYFHKVNG